MISQRFFICLIWMALMTTILKSASNAERYSIHVLIGTEVRSLIPFVAQQRIAIFREYPYLYEGNIDEEYRYLDWFSKLSQSAVAVAYVDNNPVGFITGTSFVEFDAHFNGSQDIFKAAGLNPEDYYYFSEVIVMPEHRGHNLCTQLFQALERVAHHQFGYTKGCFVTESHKEHPLKPKNYKELDPLWTALGYAKTSMAIHFRWTTIQPQGQAKEKEHSMHYWIKESLS